MDPCLQQYLHALADGRQTPAPPELADEPTLAALAAAIGQLRESEQKYRLMTEHVSVGIIVVRDGRFCYVNPSALAVTGYAADEVLDRDFLPLVHPEDREMVADRYRRRLAGNPVEPRYEFRVLRRDGSIAWVQLAAVMIPWEGGTAMLSFINDITDRVQAETALRRSEERYRTVINGAPGGMGIVIVRGNRILLANPALESMLGLSENALCEKTSFLDLVHPDDRGLMAGVARQAIESPTGSQVITTFRVRAVDGRDVWVEGNSIQVEWEGHPATLAYIRDITKRRELEQKVEAALAERETMLENSAVGIAFLSPDGRLRWANKPMAGIFGTDVAVSVGASLEPFYESRAEYLRIGGAVSAAVLAGRHFSEEVRMRRADGSTFWVYLSGKAVNPKDLAQGTVWVVMDITLRKELENALRRKTSEQEAILQSTQIGITYSVDRVHQWCNATFAAMIGYEMDEIIGHTSEIHFPDHDAWRDLGAAAYPLLVRGEAFAGEVQLKRKDGGLFWVQLHGKAVDPDDAERGSIWTFVDITQRRQAEEDIRSALAKQRELNELKTRFVSMTSHEFRTPLATILSSTELLRHYGDRLPDTERTDILGSIEIAVKRMTQMLEGILMIGRADAGRLEFAPTPQVPAALLQAMADEAARAAAGATGISRLRFRSATGGAAWLLDEGLLRHVVGNLVGNAFKYSPEGGSVEVSVAEEDGWLDIRVRDQGIGIPAADLPRLFDTFHRASNVGTISGTGLGLAIVKRAAELHGGRVAVESVAGEGACFSVRLPLHPPMSGNEDAP